MPKVQLCIEKEWLGITYFKCRDRVYFPNLRDPRPSRQLFAWSVPDDTSEQTQMKW